ncbi:hypothetical protein [Hyunsoonleella pacifica]|uniref:DUF2892 domain-containing protein n=1 Tax=Hyunsoonleella pacifica TaxID=1080224 RepID=A0A4Q9FSJ2_9FLAO|nr:hypothetical protein [Hyunsoonleella pacifica]TBN16687.1 hypothetical protein EYD46_08630 [Hyunsoonleella pacifica]GGD17330.1 hypothetical protein GCM10011368_19080 [Hyunsoonleella pacifica]
MSTKLIILIIGVLFIIIALLTVKKSSSSKLGIPLGILGVLMMIYGSYSSDFVNYNTQVEQISTGNKLKISGPVNAVKVVSPVDKDSVDCRILTMGIYPESNKNDIWVLIRPTDDRYYPQSDHTNTSYKRDGEWQVVTRFGGDLGEAYDLIIYEADSTATSFFSETIVKWKEADDYPGLKLEELPSGAKEVDRIKIYTKKNCRGVF